MTNKTFKLKLNKMVELGNEIDAAAKETYGPSACLFHEADGSLVVIIDKLEGRNGKDLVRHSSSIHPKWGHRVF
jgi:hypothetical protein